MKTPKNGRRNLAAEKTERIEGDDSGRKVVISPRGEIRYVSGDGSTQRVSLSKSAMILAEIFDESSSTWTPGSLSKWLKMAAKSIALHEAGIPA